MRAHKDHNILRYWKSILMNNETIIPLCLRYIEKSCQFSLEMNIIYAYYYMNTFYRQEPTMKPNRDNTEKHKRLLLAIARVALWRPRRFATSSAQRLKGIFFIPRLSRPQYCTRTVNQHGAQITVATLGDAEQNRFATGAVLPRGSVPATPTPPVPST